MERIIAKRVRRRRSLPFYSKTFMCVLMDDSSEQIFALELTIDINNSSAGSRLIFDEAAGLQLICPTNVEKEPMQAKNLARSAPFRAKRHRHSRSRF